MLYAVGAPLVTQKQGDRSAGIVRRVENHGRVLDWQLACFNRRTSGGGHSFTPSLMKFRIRRSTMQCGRRRLQQTDPDPEVVGEAGVLFDPDA